MLKKIILILFASILLLSAIFPHTAMAATAKVYIDPPIVPGLIIGETFAINVTVSDVTGLRGWEFTLYYNSAVLNATSNYPPYPIIEGPFLKAGGSTFFVVPIFDDNYNATHGCIAAYCFLLGSEAEAPSQSGSGTLATITFKALASGDSALDLEDTKIRDGYDEGGRPIPIPHTTIDGSAYVRIHDVAVTNTIPSKTVTNDTTVNINVTVENQGEGPETFDVTLYYDTNLIETKTLTNLPPGIHTIQYSWDTTPIPKGTYTINVEATTVLGETDTGDNIHTDGTITETILGDVNGDWEVDIFDVVAVATAFGSYPGNPRWNPNVDLVEDDIIDIFDVVLAATNFGRKI